MVCIKLIGMRPLTQNMCMGIGIIVRDCEGQLIAAKSQTISVRQEPVVAEAQAALCAEEFCCDLRLQDIILEGDSSQAVNANGPNWCRYGQLVVDI